MVLHTLRGASSAFCRCASPTKGPSCLWNSSCVYYCPSHARRFLSPAGCSALPGRDEGSTACSSLSFELDHLPQHPSRQSQGGCGEVSVQQKSHTTSFPKTGSRHPRGHAQRRPRHVFPSAGAATGGARESATATSSPSDAELGARKQRTICSDEFTVSSDVSADN